MNDFTPTELTSIADYFAGELTSAEAITVERWIEADPDRKKFVDSMLRSRIDLSRRLGVDINELPSQVEMLSRTFADVRKEGNTSRAQNESNMGARKEIGRSSWLKRLSVSYTMGAVFASVLLVAAGWYFSGTRNSVSDLASLSTYTTRNGERARITLPDGSTIVLNVASKVQIPTNFSSGNRIVYLSGEALFTVTHYEGAPFTVISGPSTTRVLGTSFVVRHYSSDTSALVVVRDGKVAVDSKVLTAGQQVSVTNDRVGETQHASVARFGFAAGKLTIDDMPLPSAIAELNRWYDAEINLGDTILNSRNVFGVFMAGSSLTDLAMMLEWTFNVRVERDGRMLTLYPKE